MTLLGPGTLGGALISVVKKKRRSNFCWLKTKKFFNDISYFLNTNPINNRLLSFPEKKKCEYNLILPQWQKQDDCWKAKIITGPFNKPMNSPPHFYRTKGYSPSEGPCQIMQDNLMHANNLRCLSWNIQIKKKKGPFQCLCSSSSLLMFPFTNKINLKLSFSHPSSFKLSEEFRS